MRTNYDTRADARPAAPRTAAPPGQTRRSAALSGTAGMGYDEQVRALSPQVQASADKKPKEATPLYQQESVPGIFLVQWTPAQVQNLVREFAAYAGIKIAWDPATFLMTFAGVDEERKAARVAEKRWSQQMHDAWVDALVKAPRHSVVIGAQEGDFDKVRGGYATRDMMVLDMVDLATFQADTPRVQDAFNTYWVLTHELLGHFYLGLGHGSDEGYQAYDINTYSYENDDTIQKMNEWRIQMGLPVRLQHPPRVEGQKRSYIFVDAYPDQPDIDLDARAPDPNVKLPPVEERKKKFDELRAKVQNQLRVPDELDVRYFPECSFTDDDSDARGEALPGRGDPILPLLRRGSRGDEVKLCQEKLVEHGFVLDVDGIFGPITDRTVRDFQASPPDPIAVDGLVGPDTWSKLLGYRVATEQDMEERRAGKK